MICLGRSLNEAKYFQNFIPRMRIHKSSCKGIAWLFFVQKNNVLRCSRYFFSENNVTCSRYFFFLVCITEADIVFLIDSSGSIRHNNPPGAQNDGPNDNYQLEKNFVNSVIRELGADLATGGIHVGAVLFGTEVENPFYLNTYERDIQSITNHINGLRYMRSKTNMARALIDMRDVQFIPQNGDRPEAPNIAILITDGRNEPSDQDMHLSPVDEANRAKTRPNDHIQIFTVGITNEIDENQLRAISSNNRVFRANDFQALSNLLYNLTSLICTSSQGNVKENSQVYSLNNNVSPHCTLFSDLKFLLLHSITRIISRIRLSA